MEDLSKLKMDHALLVNEKTVVTDAAVQIHCAAIGAGLEFDPDESVEAATKIVKAVGEKYDDRIEKIQDKAMKLMAEMQEKQSKMMGKMHPPGGCPGHGLEQD